MKTWIKIADSPENFTFNDAGLTALTVRDKRICLARWDGALYAVAGVCPHGGVPLDGGYIDVRGQLVCPLHRYRFRLYNGYNSSGEGYYLSHWKVEVREDGVWVEM